MSDVITLTAPVAIFGDPTSEVWGVLVAGEQPKLLVSGGADAEFTDADIDVDDGEVWTVAAGGNELRVELAQATTQTYEDGSVLAPCRVAGQALIDGIAREIDLPGVVLLGELEGKTAQVRLVGSWFPAGHEVSLASFRPSGAKGHDGDGLDVIALGEEQKIIFDPRLSTTYNGDGSPRRAGIELWLGDEGDDEQFPRRVAGVATGAAASTQAAGLKLSAYSLHTLSRGEPGAGVYVLLTA